MSSVPAYFPTYFPSLRLFLTNISIREQGIPFKITMDVPNAETLKAIHDAENGIGLSKGFISVEELTEELNADD